jgi:hypothetical protein
LHHFINTTITTCLSWSNTCTYIWSWSHVKLWILSISSCCCCISLELLHCNSCSCIRTALHCIRTCTCTVLPWSRSHVTADDQSVSMPRYRAHSGTCDQILLSVQRLFSESCCLVSVMCPLTRGRVCHYCLAWGLRSRYDWWSVSQSVLASSPPWDLWPDINSVWMLLLSLLGALSDERPGLSVVSHCQQ